MQFIRIIVCDGFMRIMPGEFPIFGKTFPLKKNNFFPVKIFNHSPNIKMVLLIGFKGKRITQNNLFLLVEESANDSLTSEGFCFFLHRKKRLTF